jgi:hypothetical protein
MFRVLVALPYSFSFYYSDKSSTKISFAYSNVPGPEVPFDWGIVKVHKITSVGPAMGRMINSFIVLSVNGKVSFSLITGKGFIE